MNTLGIDISVWQDDNSTSQIFDPVKARSKGATFVGIKASQANWADPDFKQNWNVSKGILYRMPYHFLVWNVDPKMQAETFLKQFENDTYGTLPLICDFEWWNTTPNNALDYIYGFLERMKQLTNLPLGIYTAKSFWDQYGNKNDYWKQYYLWLCDISGAIEVPSPWDKWFVRQYTFKLRGPEWGVESLDLDGDYYNGTLEDMIKEFNLPQLQDVALPEKQKELYMRVLRTVNIRTGPGTNYSDVGDFYAGDLVGPIINVGGGKTGAWVKIANNQWVCVADTYNNVYLAAEE